MNIVDYNRRAWDHLVAQGNQWTQPVASAQIAAARRGEWRIVLTPDRPVPSKWFGDLAGRDVLCLASGGGQQGPVLAAAGARVTVYDNSQAQLNQDEMVARREGLHITTVQGDMQELKLIRDETFDLIVNPCSIAFVPQTQRVWNEAHRVLRPGGRLMSGFANPLYYLFDYWQMLEGKLEVKYSIPYCDERDLSPEDRQRLLDANEPLEFGHSLEDLIGGQIEAGFHICGFYEDGWPDKATSILSQYINCFMATLAIKSGVHSDS